MAARLLERLGIRLCTYTKAIGPVSVPEEEYDFNAINTNPLYMPSSGYAEKAQAYLTECIESLDSAGGVIECQVTGLPAGIGEPVFQKLDASLARGIMSIGAVKGVEIPDPAGSRQTHTLHRPGTKDRQFPAGGYPAHHPGPARSGDRPQSRGGGRSHDRPHHRRSLIAEHDLPAGPYRRILPEIVQKRQGPDNHSEADA